MASLNKFIGIGNLCADIEVRQVGQSQVGKVNVAISEKYRKADGSVGENTEFVTIELWDKANIYQYLTKGISVYFEGRLASESWTDTQGAKHTTTKIRVANLQILTPRQQTAQPQAAPAPQYAPQPTAPAPAPQPQYNAPAPPAPPQYAQPAPPAPPSYAAPNTPINPGYAPNSPYAAMNANGETPDADMPF